MIHIIEVMIIMKIATMMMINIIEVMIIMMIIILKK